MTFKKLSAVATATLTTLVITACGGDTEADAKADYTPTPAVGAVDFQEYPDGSNRYVYQATSTPPGGPASDSPKTEGTTTVSISCSGEAKTWSEGDGETTEPRPLTADVRHPYVFYADNPEVGGVYYAIIEPDDPETACGANVYDGEGTPGEDTMYSNRGKVTVEVRVPGLPEE
ncbi:hypothetical protein [Corynebacterium sp.]|uniref:hypothetical protein n=1 Tax=Corynebacterium sp. TaxID=1720 RepID=UPI0028A6E1D2|nr:hypothetical protein [Corynebacterium sp.]